MTHIDIHQFACLKDNYGVLIHDAEGGQTASIDAPNAAAVKAALKEKGWQLTHILVTHHHADHTGGILDLKAETACTVIGPKGEAARIPGLDTPVGEPDSFRFGRFEVRVIDTPGHTIGQVSYWLPDAAVAFAGDTLFSMGCGRILEGTAPMMYASLKKIAALPPETSLYCGHEYTVANGKFGLTIEPENEALRQHLEEAEAQRAAGKPTLPTTVGRELETNVFLRPNVPAIRKRLGFNGEPDWRVFAEIRERKNKF